MVQKKLISHIGNYVVSLGNKSVQKSMALGMYEPVIPDILNTQSKKKGRFLKLETNEKLEK